MARRKPSRADRQAAYYRALLQSAATGAQALEVAWRWLTAALCEVAVRDPRRAEQARRDIAGQLAGIAADAHRTTRGRAPRGGEDRR